MHKFQLISTPTFYNSQWYIYR